MESSIAQAHIDNTERNEKDEDVSDVEAKLEQSPSNLSLIEADEALKIVGALRSKNFSDTYNARLRRKLVSPVGYAVGLLCTSTLLRT